jgi:hypothetical protein
MFGGSGDDRLDAVDDRRDAVINCGPGNDRAVIDRMDPFPQNCEVVRRR